MQIRPNQAQSQLVGLHKGELHSLVLRQQKMSRTTLARTVSLLRIAPAPKVIIAGDSRTIGDSRSDSGGNSRSDIRSDSGSDGAAHQAKGASCEDCEPLVIAASQMHASDLDEKGILCGAQVAHSEW